MGGALGLCLAPFAPKTALATQFYFYCGIAKIAAEIATKHIKYSLRLNFEGVYQKS